MEIGIVGLGRTGANVARPLFDLVLLGLGEDGHICSLLPGSPALEERRRRAVPVAQGRPEKRITKSYLPVQSSRVTAFLVLGEKKADSVSRSCGRFGFAGSAPAAGRRTDLVSGSGRR